jgi:hypothetical protein
VNCYENKSKGGMTMRNQVRALLLTVAILAGTVLTPLVQTAEAASQADIYVGPSGNDTTGTGTSANPYKSLNRARQAVAAINSNMSSYINVYFKAGTYDFTQTVNFGPADSGTNGHFINYIPESGATVTFNGGKKITSTWTLFDSSKNIYRTAVSGLGNFRQLYVNNKLAIRARFPNITSGSTHEAVFKTTGAYTGNTTDTDPSHRYLTVNTADLPSGLASNPNLNNIEMVDTPHWYHENLRIDHIAAHSGDATKSDMFIESPENNVGLNTGKGNNFYTGNPYFFENDLSFLDAGGEWYLDIASNYLYYKPLSGEVLGTVEVVVPQLEKFIDISGTLNGDNTANTVSNLSFRLINFKFTNWSNSATDPNTHGIVATQGVQLLTVPGALNTESPSAVRVKYAQNISFDANTFQFTAANGLNFYQGVKDSEIVNNTFTQIGGNGIVLDGSEKCNPSDTFPGTLCYDSDLTSNILVGNNKINNYGKIIYNGLGILSSWASNMTIERNEIAYSPFGGMQLGNQTNGYVDTHANFNIVRNNKVHDVMLSLDDSGGIYTLGRQYGTQIYENWIYNVNRGVIAMNNPIGLIYNDNFSEFMTDEHNVLDFTAGTYDTGTRTMDIFKQKVVTTPPIIARNVTNINNLSLDNHIYDSVNCPDCNTADVNPPTYTADRTAIINASGPVATASYFKPIKVEAENMTLSAGYTVESGASGSDKPYSNEAGITTSSATASKAQYTTDASVVNGSYNIRIGYVRENDGNPTYTIKVNGTQVGTVTAIPAQYSQTYEAVQYVAHGVTLKPGDVIEVSGLKNSGGLARLDFMEIYK